jgi:hypothetical protein
VVAATIEQQMPCYLLAKANGGASNQRRYRQWHTMAHDDTGGDCGLAAGVKGEGRATISI